MGILGGRVDEEVNLVNAPSLAEERGISVRETREPNARDFSDLVRVTIAGGGERVRVVGTLVGRRNRSHLLEAWGQRFNLQLEGHLALFRYRDVPGQIGRVGTALGERGINIGAAAVGHGDDSDDLAVMVVPTEQAVPQDVIDALVASGDFIEGRTVSLS